MSIATTGVSGRAAAVATTVALISLLAPPAASAWRQSDGNYWDVAAGSRRPMVVLAVRRNLGQIGIEIPRCGGVSRNYLRQRAFEIERRAFDFTAPLPPQVIRIGRPRPNDRIRVVGRWISPRSAVGRYRMWRTLVNRRTRRITSCDTKWVAWRAARYDPVTVRVAWPARFAVPGTVTGSIVVRNAGDFASPNTLVRISPASQSTDPDVVAPAFRVVTSQGTCSWPVTVDEARLIECRLGTLRPRRTVTVSVTETWDARTCAASDSTGWSAGVRSPLNYWGPYGREWIDADEPDEAQAACPGDVPETEPEPEPEY